MYGILVLENLREESENCELARQIGKLEVSVAHPTIMFRRSLKPSKYTVDNYTVFPIANSQMDISFFADTMAGVAAAHDYRNVINRDLFADKNLVSPQTIKEINEELYNFIFSTPATFDSEAIRDFVDSSSSELNTFIDERFEYILSNFLRAVFFAERRPTMSLVMNFWSEF